MLRLMNPLERGLGFKGLLYWTLYLVFLGASVWATAESIARTVSLPNVFCYIISIAFLSGASFCLALVKKSLSPDYVRARVPLLVIGLIGFFFLWLISFTSNSHSFYFVSTVDDIRRSEVGDVLDKLRLIQSKASFAVETAKDALRAEVESKIKNMKSEILNPGDPGSGIETERIIVEIENLLESEIQSLDRPSGGLPGLKRYADAMASQIREILEVKLAEIDRSAARVNEYVSSSDFSDAQLRLAEALKVVSSRNDPDRIKELLRSTFELYNRGVDFITQAFEKPLLSKYIPTVEKLPEVPRSIRLENIAAAWKDFLGGHFEPYKFWLSVLWSIALDLAAFILFYFGILAKPDDL